VYRPAYSPVIMRSFPVIAITVAGVLLLGGQPAAAQDLGGELLTKPGRVVQLGPGAKELPPLMARTWLIADARTGEILAAKGAHRTRAPASTLKMLTALTVIPKLPLDSTTVARAKAVNMYGARVGLVKGKTYTIEQLMNAMMLPSANDAAVALAQANGGITRTVSQMNELAAQLQARNTVARNPSGLDAPGQQSTAYDLALIARAGLAQPTFADFVKRTKAEFPKKGKKMRPIYTTNRLLLGNYPGVVGVKTGFTSNAGRTYVGAATRNGRTLIVSFMGVRERTDVAAAKLLTWGFANADKVTPIGVLVDPISTVAADVEPEGGGVQPLTVVETPVAQPPVEPDVVAVPELAPTGVQPVVWAAVAAAIGLFLIALMAMALRARTVRRARHVARR